MVQQKNRGGTGTTWIVVTDADGNTSYLALHMQGGNIEYQEFHAEDMIADNADVEIQGPTAVDEDGNNQWKVIVPDSNLPEEDEDIFEVKWTGPPVGTCRLPEDSHLRGVERAFPRHSFSPVPTWLL